MRLLGLMSLLLVLVSVPVLADGPETGVVSGKVTDAGGAALPGVMVTLTGDRGSNNVVTDGEGNYRFALLPPGAYKLQAALEGFTTAEGVANVTAGGKVEVNMKMSLGTAEEITVTSEAPMVDKFDVSTGGTVQAETVGEVAAVFRGIYGAINALPGVTNDQESLDLSSSRPSFNGSSWIESAVFVDGVDTTFTPLRCHPHVSAHVGDLRDLADHRGQGRGLRSLGRRRHQRHRQDRHQQLPRRSDRGASRPQLGCQLQVASRARGSSQPPAPGRLLRLHGRRA